MDLASLDELEGIQVGVARAEAYAACEETIAERRARGLFGDLRFTLTNTARSCHPERLVRGARSVIAVAMSVVQDGPFTQPVVLTPHAGEMAHLTGLPKERICGDPQAAAVDGAHRWNTVVALKGASTHIATPSGQVSVSSST